MGGSHSDNAGLSSQLTGACCIHCVYRPLHHPLPVSHTRPSLINRWDMLEEPSPDFLHCQPPAWLLWQTRWSAYWEVVLAGQTFPRFRGASAGKREGVTVPVRHSWRLHTQTFDSVIHPDNGALTRCRLVTYTDCRFPVRQSLGLLRVRSPWYLPVTMLWVAYIYTLHLDHRCHHLIFQWGLKVTAKIPANNFPFLPNTNPAAVDYFWQHVWQF